MERIEREYFTGDPVDCARGLIGCVFRWDGCAGRIVETEAYHAVGDEACHTFFRPSVREFVARHAPGDAYVYLNYGVHWLFNIVVKGSQGEGFVLLRAVEPIEGLAEMASRRGGRKIRDIANGPAKLTRAMGIDGRAHGESFLLREDGGIFSGEVVETVAGARVGISKAVELPWRFGEKGSRFLSRAF